MRFRVNVFRAIIPYQSIIQAHQILRLLVQALTLIPLVGLAGLVRRLEASMVMFSELYSWKAFWARFLVTLPLAPVQEHPPPPSIIHPSLC